MSGLSETEKKILRFKLQRKSGYRIGRELDIDPPNVYRVIKKVKQKIKKFRDDLRELGIVAPELDKLLQDLEQEVAKETAKEEIPFAMR